MKSDPDLENVINEVESFINDSGVCSLYEIFKGHRGIYQKWRLSHCHIFELLSRVDQELSEAYLRRRIGLSGMSHLWLTNEQYKEVQDSLLVSMTAAEVNRYLFIALNGAYLKYGKLPTRKRVQNEHTKLKLRKANDDVYSVFKAWKNCFPSDRMISPIDLLKDNRLGTQTAIRSFLYRRIKQSCLHGELLRDLKIVQGLSIAPDSVIRRLKKDVPELEVALRFLEILKLIGPDHYDDVKCYFEDIFIYHDISELLEMESFSSLTVPILAGPYFPWCGQESMAKIAQDLKIKTNSEYLERFMEDDRLHGDPERLFGKSWSGFRHFLIGSDVGDFCNWPRLKTFSMRSGTYPTKSEATKASESLNIQTSTEYWDRYKEDPHLPSNPADFYPDWNGWADFLNVEKRNCARSKCFHKNLEEAMRAVKTKKPGSRESFHLLFADDDRMPFHPERVYSDEWKGWGFFLGKEENYENLDEFIEAIKTIKVTSQTDFYEKKHLDPKLPGRPDKYYKEWKGWGHALGKKEKYHTLIEAMLAVRSLGIRTASEYKERYKEDPLLPSNPNQFYKSDWVSWLHFLGK